MNDHHMSAFVTVIDCGSISKAARLLFITPQALSQQMDLLERECGAKLMVRSSQGVSLTAAGELFYGFAEESLSRQNDTDRSNGRPSIEHGHVRTPRIFPDASGI